MIVHGVVSVLAFFLLAFQVQGFLELWILQRNYCLQLEEMKCHIN